MTRWVVALVACLAFVPIVMAGDAEQDIERELDEARRQVDEAARRLADLHKKQYAHGGGKNKAMLGILLGDVSTDGVQLVGVTPGGGAQQAGLQAGDRIVKLNELSLDEAGNPMRTLVQYMKNVAPGDEVTVIYERNGERASASITTQAHNTHMLKIISDEMDDLDLDLNIDLQELAGAGGIRKILVNKARSPRRLLAVAGDLAGYFDVEAGIVVLEPAAGSELKAGDVLLRVGAHEVDSIESALAALRQIDERAAVVVKRRGQPQTVSVAAGEFAAVTAKTKVRIRHSDDDHDEAVVSLDADDC